MVFNFAVYFLCRRHVFFVDAGIHAREWVAPAAASYLIYKLAEGGDHGSGLASRGRGGDQEPFGG